MVLQATQHVGSGTVRRVHPIEHLRYVARARGADASSLVRETAYALSMLGFDPSGLVVATRRIVERHPECAPLWWLCARLLTASDPDRVAWTLPDELDHDPTARRLAGALVDDATVVTIGDPELIGDALVRRGDVDVLVVDARHSASSFLRRLERADVACEPVQPEAIAAAVATAQVVLLEAIAVSDRRALVPIGSVPAALAAQRSGVPVWLVAGVGRCLPDGFVVAMAERMDTDAECWDADHEILDLDLVSNLVVPTGVVATSAVHPDCAFTPELLRASHI